MVTWQFIVALIATTISIANLTYLAWSNHDHKTPRTLSELAASSNTSLTYFRWILAICGSLFGVAVLGSLSNFEHELYVGAAAVLMVASNMLIALFPARDKRDLFLHNLFAVLMAIGMISLAYLFLFELQRTYLIVAIIIAIAMSIFGTAANLDRKRYIYFELPYIFLSHISILVVLFARANT
jgi:hypothetical protein